ncbi:hypothetical protein SeLEV6574_g01745 [Synchytrium endobioticum]|nr:hypothetical protein SeLEV6574_g01745 [Synchytrium endobioticum]
MPATLPPPQPPPLHRKRPYQLDHVDEMLPVHMHTVSPHAPYQYVQMSANDAILASILNARKKPPRKRTTPEQLNELCAVFETTRSPSFEVREALSQRLAMTNREVQIWFQNRRAKVLRERLQSQDPSSKTKTGSAKRSSNGIHQRTKNIAMLQRQQHLPLHPNATINPLMMMPPVYALIQNSAASADDDRAMQPPMVSFPSASFAAEAMAMQASHPHAMIMDPILGYSPQSPPGMSQPMMSHVPPPGCTPGPGASSDVVPRILESASSLVQNASNQDQERELPSFNHCLSVDIPIQPLTPTPSLMPSTAAQLSTPQLPSPISGKSWNTKSISIDTNPSTKTDASNNMYNMWISNSTNMMMLPISSSPSSVCEQSDYQIPSCLSSVPPSQVPSTDLSQSMLYQFFPNLLIQNSPNYSPPVSSADASNLQYLYASPDAGAGNASVTHGGGLQFGASPFPYAFGGGTASEPNGLQLQVDNTPATALIKQTCASGATTSISTNGFTQYTDYFVESPTSALLTI